MTRQVRKLHITVEFDAYTVLDPRKYPSGYASSTNLVPRLRAAIRKAIQKQIRTIKNFKVEVEGFGEEEK